MKEEWKWIEGYEGMYEISSEGNVRSYVRSKKPKPIKPYHDPRGYVQVVFTVKRKGKTHWLHRLVAQAFVDNPHNKPEVNHENGIKHDNRACNLNWVTSSENTIHGYRAGLIKPPMVRGEQCNKKLSNKKVLAIRSEYIPRKVTLEFLAKKYNISRTMVKNIVYRKSWTHI